MITIKTYNIIDLFSGAGGLSLGFKQTGKINIVAAAENNPNARKTYKRNFAEVKRLYPDVRTIDYNELKEAVGQVDIVIGGPPCQGFSNANRQHSTIISMNNRLVKEYVRAICELQPTAFVMENVAMLKSQVHRFFLEENDMTNAKILNLPLREDNIEILPQNMNFEGSRELILSAPNGVQYAWAETFYKTINLLYRYRINQPKFDLSLTKYEKKLVPQLQELFRGFNGTESSNRIQQKDSFMAIQILNYIENKEKREESFDRVIQAIRDSLLIQRALLKVKELSDNNIHVFDYVEKDGGLYATVKSYSVLDYLQGILENEPYNYTLKCDTLNAISFGAPQRRERFIMVGLKKDLNIEYPEPQLFQKHRAERAPEERFREDHPHERRGVNPGGMALEAVSALWKAQCAARQSGRGQDLFCHAPCRCLHQRKVAAQHGAHGAIQRDLPDSRGRSGRYGQAPPDRSGRRP